MADYNFEWLMDHIEKKDYTKQGMEDAQAGSVDSLEKVEGIKACVADLLLTIERVKGYYEDKIQETEETLSELIDQGVVTKIAIYRDKVKNYHKKKARIEKMEKDLAQESGNVYAKIKNEYTKGFRKYIESKNN